MAERVGERAAEAWYQSHAGGRSEVAVGVVAALALMASPPPGRRGPDTKPAAKALLAMSDAEIVKALREVWGQWWIHRPDLARLRGPIAGWLEDEEPRTDLVRGAAAVARAAVKAGLLEMAGVGLLADCDVIGSTYMAMKADKDRQARGEFYSPPDICKAMALMTLNGPLEPGMKIGEPSAGTGGMLRAAAEVIRERGLHPGEFWWVANDVSPVSVAGLAVNCHLWGLGPRTVLGVADTLREPDWPEAAWKAQRDAIAWRDELMRHARILAAIRRLEQPHAAEPATPEPPAPAPVPSRLPDGPVVQLSLFDVETEAVA